MARQLRIQFPGAIYHITARGNAGQRIFFDDRDRERFLQRLAESLESYNVRLYLFCLIVNHYHLVAETPEANLGRFMQSLETGYTVYFNLRHKRSGHLTQGRYKAKLVEGNEYLLKLSRYVHLNPVKVGSLKNLPLAERRELLRNYRWSTYLSYVGLRKPLEFVDYEPMLALTGAKQRQRLAAYRKFVETGMAETDEEFMEAMNESARSLGSDSFRQWVDREYKELLEKSGKPEDVAFRREVASLSSDTILDVVSLELGIERAEICQRRRGSVARPVAAEMLCKYGGLTKRAAAPILGLKTGAAVAWQIGKVKEFEGVGSGSRRLLAAMARIERELEQKRRSTNT